MVVLYKVVRKINMKNMFPLLKIIYRLDMGKENTNEGKKKRKYTDFPSSLH